jgi:hypothetical protein
MGIRKDYGRWLFQGISFACSGIKDGTTISVVKMTRNILYSLLIIVTISSVALGQELTPNRIEEAYLSSVSAQKGNNPPPSIDLQNITDTLSDYVIGHAAVHRIGFQLPFFDDRPVGLLRGRRIVITFPSEFDLSTIEAVSYSDTDDESDDPRIESIDIYSNSIVVQFKDKIPGPENPNFAHIILHSLNNPMKVGDYQVIVAMENHLGQTIAGPGYSEPFTIISSQAVTLEITPTDDLTLRAGEGISFEAEAVDQYGNPIPTGMIEWSFDHDLDSVGQFYGSFLLATRTGQGRVIARVDDLEARSGLITVLPGDFAVLDIELQETQFIGHPFKGIARVIVYDEYGNIVTDFDETGTELHVSSSIGAIAPETISPDAFTDGIAELGDFVYTGEPGLVNLTVSDADDIDGSAEFWANGIHGIFDGGTAIPDWLLTGWEFISRGKLWNPANQTPVEVFYSAGFIESDAPPSDLPSQKECLPPPFNERYCRFSFGQLADMTPGTYGFILKVGAIYENGSETVTTQWTFNTEIQVDEFIPFTYEPVNLPDTGIAADYIDTGIVNLFSSNVLDRPISVNPGLFIVSDNFEFFMGSRPFTLDGESVKELAVEMHFRSGLIPGIYTYQVKTQSFYYAPDMSSRISYRAKLDLDNEIEIVAPEQLAIQISSVKNDAFNTPFVNTGQPFYISASLSNLSSVILDGPFILELTTDGLSETPAPYILEIMPTTDTPLVISFPVVAAAEPNPAEIFTLNFTSVPDGIEVLLPLDNNAAAIIQMPANLSVVAEIVGQPGPVAMLAYGQEFKISAGFINTGQAQVDGGTVILDYTGSGDFGIGFPNEQSFDQFIPWVLTAPNEDIVSNFSVIIGNIPVDLNTGQPALVTNDSVMLDFEISQAEAKLIIQAGGFDTRPLERGIASKLFELSLQNSTEDNRNTLALQQLEIILINRDGNPINAEELINESSSNGTNFYLDGEPVAVRAFNTGRLIYDFPNLAILPGQVITLEYRLMPKADAVLDFFNMRLDSDNITARLIAGPQAGQRVPVTGLLDRAFEVSIPQVIISEEFAASFKNYPNPFNPTLQSTEIRYNLPIDSDVDIFIYTATGEEVRHLHFDAGANGGQAGLNAGIFWDGHNGSGDMVLNGVYFAYIKVAASDLTATVSMAVVK